MTQTLRTAFALVLLVALTIATGLAQKPSPAETQLKAAITKEVVDGDLSAAIKQYQAIVDKYGKTDRAVAAQALMRMGECYERQGNAQSRKAYQRLLSEYGDQKDLVAQAQARLAALGAGAVAPGTSGSTGPRRLLESIPATADGQPTGESISRIEVTRDGRRLVFTTGGAFGRLAVRDLGSGEEHVISGFRAIASPDGRQLAVWDPGGLRITAIDGSSPRTIPKGNCHPLRWTDDGRWLICLNWSNLGQGLPPAGKDPDVKTVLSARLGIYAIAVTDGAVRSPASPAFLALGETAGPAVSPDGRFLAHLASAPPPGTPEGTAQKSSGRSLLKLTNLETGKTTQISGPADDDSGPVWTSDSSALLFVRQRNGERGLWMVRVENGEPQEAAVLVKDRVGEIRPIGITSSGSLYYLRTQAVQTRMTVSIDQVAGKTTGKPIGVRDMPPACGYGWSPDGRSIAYAGRLARTSPDTQGPCPGSVLVLRNMTDGSERVVSTELAEFRRPRWSPDGRSILLTGRKDGVVGIFRVDVASGATTLIVSDPQFSIDGDLATLADWSPDGKGIYVPRKAGVQSWLMYRDLASGQETEKYSTKVTREPGSSLFYFSATSVAPDGSLCLLVDSGTDGSRSAVVLPAGGGEARRVYTAKGLNLFPSVAFAADGRGIWISQRQPTPENSEARELLWVPVDGGNPVHAGLTMSGMDALMPSPDGTQLFFGVFGTANELWVLENLLPKAPGAAVKK